MNRQMLASALEVSGAVSLIVGASLVAAAAGFVVGGALGLVFAWRLSR